MCDGLSSSVISLSLSEFPKLQTLTRIPKFRFPIRSKLPGNATESCVLFPARKFSGVTPYSLSSDDHGFPADLGFKEADDCEDRSEKERKRDRRATRSGGGDEDLLGFLEPKNEEEDLIRLKEGHGGSKESLVADSGRTGTRKRRQMVRRSGLLAKQVISIRTALSLGFVSQLWVDIDSWVVLFVEVRPNLLSGECERFLLEDISQVGDVVLVEDERVIDNEYKMIGLETLVGYKVVTPGRRNIGKVRGFTFNINSGVIESLELDSFGISIIPSSLVSTYALLVDDVSEVLSDAIVIHESAASNIQRLTKGFLDSENVGTNIDDLQDFSYEQNTTSLRRRKFRSRSRDMKDDWELPIDYL